MAATRTDDLAAIIDALDAQGHLVRVKSEADPRHELPGIAQTLESGARPILFEKVRGHRWPVLAGLYWDHALVAGLLGREEAALARFLAGCIAASRAASAQPAVVKSGLVLAVTEKETDLGKIPVPVHAPKDGGPYLTAAIAIAKDPETGARRIFLPRAQVAGRDSLRLRAEPGGTLELHLDKAKRLGRSVWITLNVGAGLGLQIAAAMPGAGEDGLAAAGAIGGAPVELIPGTESDVELAAGAMWALECEIVPGELAREGPIASIDGLYAPAIQSPVAHVRRVHRRETPVFQTLLSGAEARLLTGLAGEAAMLALLQRQVPGVVDACLTRGGGFFHHAVVQIAARAAVWSKQAILAAFAAFPPLKMVTVVDDEVDIRNPGQVEWALATRLDAATGILRIDHAKSPGLEGGSAASKLGFDAAQPLPKRADQERVAVKSVALDKHAVAAAEARAPVQPIRPAPPVPEPAAHHERVHAAPAAALSDRTAPQAVPDAAAAAQKSNDWDEDRWLKRELEAMKRESAPTPAAVPPPSSHPPLSKPTAATPTLSKPAARPAPVVRAASPAKPEPLRAADDDEGGFFRSGTA